MAPSPADIVARTVTQTVTHFVRAAASTTSSTATSTSTAAASAGRPASYKIVGIILAVCSGLFIGISFVLKKVGLLKANVKYNQEAGEGYGYLKNAYWWGGMTLMIVGEICNFVAYAFTDAILVTPLGALSVVITTILSAIFLKERLSFVGKVGCFLCIVGSVIIPLNAPEQSAVANIQEMQHFFITPGFLVYAGVILAGCAFIALWAGPRYGKKSMLVYLSICSLIGGLSVVSTQGLGSAIVAQINGEPQFNKWFLYVLFVFVIGTLVTEIIYLNVSTAIWERCPLRGEKADCLWGSPGVPFPRLTMCMLTLLTESAEPLQRCSSHAHLLRLLHQLHYRRLHSSLPRSPRHRLPNHRHHPRLPGHLLRRRTLTTCQVRQGCSGHRCIQRRSGSNAHSRRAGGA